MPTLFVPSRTTVMTHNQSITTFQDKWPSVSETEVVGKPSEDPQPPHIPGYKIIKFLGKGGMGVVWHAIHETSQRRVALKQMHAHVFASENARARFRREVQVAAQLEHPNIARVYDCDIEQAPYYFTMELIQGQRMDHYIKAHALDHQGIMALIHTIGLAMAYAHQHGVIHRDLKPSNILVTEAGEPYIVDFGVAKRLEDDQPSLTISETTKGPGTLVYMSPEQVTGQSIDTRTDIYSLGVMAYQMLTDQFPYDLSGPEYERMQHILHQDPIALRYLDASMDRDLEAILLKTLSKEPDDRYQSMSELSRDIANWQAGHPLSIRSNHTAYVLKKLIRRHKFSSMVIGLVAIILLSFSFSGIYALQQMHHTQAETQALTNQLHYHKEQMLTMISDYFFLQVLDLWQSGHAIEPSKLIVNLSRPQYRAITFLRDLQQTAIPVEDLLQEFKKPNQWLAYCIVGEHLLKQGHIQDSQQAFHQSLEMFNRYAQPEQTSLIIAHLKMRILAAKSTSHQEEPETNS